MERETRYWIDAKAGQKTNQLFEQGSLKAWQWAEPADFIRWFTDGERRYGTSLWQLASVPLKAGEAHRAYGRRKVAARRFRSGDESQRLSGTETS